jgi:hypothetical protein
MNSDCALTMAGLAEAYRSLSDDEFNVVVDSGTLDEFLAIVSGPGLPVRFLRPGPTIN